MLVMKALHANLYDTHTMKARGKKNIKACHAIQERVANYITVNDITAERATVWSPEKMIIKFQRAPRFRDRFEKSRVSAIAHLRGK